MELNTSTLPPMIVILELSSSGTTSKRRALIIKGLGTVPTASAVSQDN